MWIADILNMLNSLRSTCIDVYEWEEADVLRTRLPNSPDFFELTTKRPSLAFNGWGLSHAVVKADYLDRCNPTMPGLGFLLQAGHLIDCRSSPIQLKTGTSNALNDFALTSLSGRVGQGLAILYGNRLGLKFNAHLRSHVASLPPGSPGAKHQNEAMADFLFSNGNETILIESKASFSLRKNDPTAIKSVLKSALTRQIDPWMGYLQPTPSNGYVIYSCLREGSWDPSSLSVVDPNGGDDKAAEVPFSSEQVMRENYGAWLRVMGLSQAADRLTRPNSIADQEAFEARPVQTEFLVYEHEGRELAFVANRPYWLRYPFACVPAAGVDLAVLTGISTVIETRGLVLSEQFVDLPSPADAPYEWGSIFPDGSVWGFPNATRLRRHAVRL